jgi:hypothetical protein
MRRQEGIEKKNRTYKIENWSSKGAGGWVARELRHKEGDDPLSMLQPQTAGI